MFTVELLNEGSFTRLVPAGRLDTINSAYFNEKLQPLADIEDYVIIDFSRCNYLSSSGIRSLMNAARKLSGKGGKMMLANLPGEVFQVIEMSGLNTFFHILSNGGEAHDEIKRLKELVGSNSEILIEGCHLKFQQIEKYAYPAWIWKNQVIAGHNELNFSVGAGSPAEFLTEDEKSRGLFVTLGNCSGFLPSGKNHTSEFRVLRDPDAGGNFLQWALSFGQQPHSRVTLTEQPGIRLDLFLDVLARVPQKTETEPLRAFLIANYDASLSSVIFGYLDHRDGPGTNGPDIPEVLAGFNSVTAEGHRILGARFLLNGLPELEPDEPVLRYINRTLTLENIEGIESVDRSVQLSRPVAWLFQSGGWTDAEDHRIRIEADGDFAFEPYQAYLTRKLYADSARVIIKPLHGGYSAQTFQVDSFDHAGRNLGPTVLKIAGRAMISREADRCRRYALPYILNNSAIVLGTSFYCDIGALRYNFVGIDGELTQLKWLTHYFRVWPVEDLEPLFDKIFLQILKPWHGQPVKGTIHPYRDHDPRMTFFPRLCEIAEEVLSIPAEVKYFRIRETDRMTLNPYWFLLHEYQARHDREMDYFTSICHGDLNMQNILLDGEMNVYLIDFSETRPRSAVSDYARLEAIFMIENAPLHSEEDMREMVEFVTRFYQTGRLDEVPEHRWTGASPEIMKRNLALTLKMRKYAVACVSGDPDIVPYYLALLEWVLPIVCYGSAPLPQKMLSAYVAGLLCEKIVECDHTQIQ